MGDLEYLAGIYKERAFDLLKLAEWMKEASCDLPLCRRRVMLHGFEIELREMARDMQNEVVLIRNNVPIL